MGGDETFCLFETRVIMCDIRIQCVDLLPTIDPNIVGPLCYTALQQQKAVSDYVISKQVCRYFRLPFQSSISNYRGSFGHVIPSYELTE